MIWPLRGDADRLTAILAGTVAVTLVLVMPNVSTTIAAFTLAGIANSLFFARLSRRAASTLPSSHAGRCSSGWGR